MSDIKYNWISKGIITGVITVFIVVSGYAIVDCNGSGISYCDDCPRINAANIVSIPVLIEDSAANFLQAHSEILEFSRLYELSGRQRDYQKWRQVVYNALDSLKNAKESYGRLISAAEATPYNKAVHERLLDYDYKGFAGRNTVNGELFGKVAAYLSTGNVTGIYKDIYFRLEKVERLLMNIEAALNEDKMPRVKDVWAINHECSEKLLFGQYVARVFFALQGIE